MSENQSKKHFRAVKSFIRRQGRMTDSQRQALQNLWPQWGLTIGNEVCDWQRVFGRQADIILEIGFGMGHSLLQLAQEHPEQDFIGIEVHEAGIANVLKGIETEQLSNIRLFKEDAMDVLQGCVPDHSLSKVLLFFPDPWHKKRHHKRRLVQVKFIQLLAKKLQSDGIFHVATDWEDYAQHVLAIMSSSEIFEPMNPKGDYHQRPDYRPLTKYEQRGLKLGHSIWDLEFRVQSGRRH